MSNWVKREDGYSELRIFIRPPQVVSIKVKFSHDGVVDEDVLAKIEAALTPNTVADGTRGMERGR